MICRLRSGIATTTLVILLVGVAAVTIGAVVWRGAASTGDSAGVASRDLFAVRRGDFDITIPASGELAALRQVEITNQLEARAVITEIVDEGEHVKAGDVLVRLDDEEIVTQIRDAQDSVNTAEAAYIAAKSSLAILRDTNKSELEQADVNIRLAELGLLAWEEGDYISQLQALELELQTATKDHTRLVERFVASEDLMNKEFISRDEYLQDEIRMLEAKSRLEQATLGLRVYKEYEAEKQRAELESALRQAQAKRIEVEQSNLNEERSAEAEVSSREFNLNSAKERLAKLERQFKACTIRAPQEGLVVYAASLGRGRRDEESPPQVGTEVHRNETIIILPDTTQMMAEVKVNEALSGRIQAGQRAVVYSDALPDTPLRGEVTNVGVLAESGGWRDPNRRDYTVRIRLFNTDGLGLKPAMRTKAEIYVGRVEDALFVPIQSVFRNGPVSFMYVPEQNGYAQREVKLGRSSELYIEVQDGLAENDRVLLREPASNRVVSRIKVPERSPGFRADNFPGDAPGNDSESESGTDQGDAQSAGQSRQPGGRQRGGPAAGSASSAASTTGENSDVAAQDESNAGETEVAPVTASEPVQGT